MYFTVIPTYIRGHRLDSRTIENRDRYTGELRVSWYRDATRSRPLQRASLLECVNGSLTSRHLIPDLLDPVLMGMTPIRFSLSGFEIVEDVEYRQSWLIEHAKKR